MFSAYGRLPNTYSKQVKLKHLNRGPLIKTLMAVHEAKWKSMFLPTPILSRRRDVMVRVLEMGRLCLWPGNLRQ